MPVDRVVELKKIEADLEKARLDFWNKLIVGGIAAFMVAAVAAAGTVYVGYLNRMSARDVELIKIDASLVSAFSSQFLAQDLGTRIRAAHLFKSIAPNEDIRSRWTAYHAELAKFNEAIILKGKDPNGNIKELFKDMEFLKGFSGLGCKDDTMGGCFAHQPPPLNLDPLDPGSPGGPVQG